MLELYMSNYVPSTIKINGTPKGFTCTFRSYTPFYCSELTCPL